MRAPSPVDNQLMRFPPLFAGTNKEVLPIIAEYYTDCSFLFAKIGGGLSELINDPAQSPTEVVAVMQMMFDKFDALADMYGVQKVRKTANEYYLVAAGLPNPGLLPSAADRAIGIASFGFAIINMIDFINLELARYGVTASVQVGIHSGAAIAGVIGRKAFQYDLCGDAVNTAARMCTHSLPGHVHVSQTTHELLKHRFASVCRGERHVKGKGRMTTYFLVGLPAGSNEVLLQHRGLTELEA